MKTFISVTTHGVKETKFLAIDSIHAVWPPMREDSIHKRRYSWANAVILGDFHNNGGLHVMESPSEILELIAQAQAQRI